MFSLYYQKALSWQYWYPQLLLLCLVHLLSVWKNVLLFCASMPLLPLPISFVSEHLMIFNIWRLKNTPAKCHYPWQRTPARAPTAKVHVCKDACPAELLECFLPWLWPKSAGTSAVTGNSLGALWTQSVVASWSGCQSTAHGMFNSFLTDTVSCHIPQKSAHTRIQVATDVKECFGK